MRFSKFYPHSSLTNPNSFYSSPTKITNDNYKNFTLLTVKKQMAIKNQRDTFIISVTAVKQLVGRELLIRPRRPPG